MTLITPWSSRYFSKGKDTKKQSFPFFFQANISEEDLADAEDQIQRVISKGFASFQSHTDICLSFQCRFCLYKQLNLEMESYFSPIYGYMSYTYFLVNYEYLF